jgi:hypothetical protein
VQLVRRSSGQYWRNLEVLRHLFHISLQALQVSTERSRVAIQVLRMSTKGACGLWAASSLIRSDYMLPALDTGPFAQGAREADVSGDRAGLCGLREARLGSGAGGEDDDEVYN